MYIQDVFVVVLQSVKIYVLCNIQWSLKRITSSSTGMYSLHVCHVGCNIGCSASWEECMSTNNKNLHVTSFSIYH